MRERRPIFKGYGETESLAPNAQHGTALIGAVLPVNKGRSILFGNTGKLTLLNLGGSLTPAEADKPIGHPLF